MMITNERASVFRREIRGRDNDEAHPHENSLDCNFFRITGLGWARLVAFN